MSKNRRHDCNRQKMGKHRQPSVRQMLLECLEHRVVLNADWQNQRNTVDVNDDGYASPLDALLIINELGRTGNANSLVGKPLPVARARCNICRSSIQVATIASPLSMRFWS